MDIDLNGSGELNLEAGPQLDIAGGISLQADDPDTGIESVDIEAEAAEEVSEILNGFKARDERECARREDATDSEFWVAVCFQTRAQKEEFLRKLGLLEIGDKYLDGMEVARKLGVTLTSPVPPMPIIRIDQKLIDLT